MYDFHYNYIKNKYVDKARLLFTDTDSLTYEIEADDVYQDFWKDKHLFDNSDYPKDSPFFDNTNKKVIGKFKDEAAGLSIVEFVGLRSKMYSYLKLICASQKVSFHLVFKDSQLSDLLLITLASQELIAWEDNREHSKRERSFPSPRGKIEKC